jgi:class 3 adenylate cyclase
MLGILLCHEVRSQTSDSIPTIHLPLAYEDFSLYDFAWVRMETEKTEIPPADITKRKFQPVKEIFDKDELRFAKNIKSFWIKFQLKNNQPSDTTIALIFPHGVSKGILYKAEGDDLIVIGKTGFFIAVLKRKIPYEDGRIDLAVKAHSTTNYFIQVILFHGIALPKIPALENVAYAELKAFNKEKKINRRNLLWNHFFTGVFFMFFVFGFIKYLVLGKDKAYLYYALLGLCSAFMCVAQAEYPPLELPWFENLRGLELFDELKALAFVLQGLFIIEILQLKIKYPRVTLAAKWLLFSGLLIVTIHMISFIISKEGIYFLYVLKIIFGFIGVLFLLGWVIYLAKNRKGFYRFIFLGALTIFTAFTSEVLVEFFNLYHLLPLWFGDDPRGRVFHFMQIALLIDLIFYFTGLAHRDRQVEKDKIKFQEESIKHLEANKKFQEQFTAELEQQVIERTAEVVEEKAEVERQKEKSDELLLNILPSEVAEELKEKGYTTAKSFDEVTVLFSDIKGFTNVAEKMTAQELVKEINTYFSAFDSIVQKNGLEKIKTIGDAYIAAGGLPEKNLATAQNVVEAAIDMQQAVEKLKQERIALGKAYFELRIGIHTGSVVAGVVGIKKFQYDFWGDTVNLAARMEQSGIPGKINISQHTYEAVKDQFNCVHRGKIEAKNKGKMDMYFVE